MRLKKSIKKLLGELMRILLKTLNMLMSLRTLLKKRKGTEEKKKDQEELSHGMNPTREEIDILLQGMINIPVVERTELIQCGTLNWVYPPTDYEYKQDRTKSNSKNVS